MMAVMGVKGSRNFSEKYRRVCYIPAMKKIIIVCMVLGLSIATHAHNLHQSSSDITVRNKTVQWDITAHDHDVERFFHRRSVTPEIVRSLLSHRIVVENNGAACPLTRAHMDPSQEEAGHYQIAMRFECAAPVSRLTLYYNLFFGERDHVHTATIHTGSTTRTMSFTGMKTSASFTTP